MMEMSFWGARVWSGFPGEVELFIGFLWNCEDSMVQDDERMKIRSLCKAFKKWAEKGACKDKLKKKIHTLKKKEENMPWKSGLGPDIQLLEEWMKFENMKLTKIESTYMEQVLNSHVIISNIDLEWKNINSSIFSLISRKRTKFVWEELDLRVTCHFLLLWLGTSAWPLLAGEELKEFYGKHMFITYIVQLT